MYLAYGDAGQESCDKLLSNQLVVDPTLPKAPVAGAGMVFDKPG